MRAADLSISRRQFLITSAKASAAVGATLILGDAVLEAIDQMGPRRLYVPGVNTEYRHAIWQNVELPGEMAYWAALQKFGITDGFRFDMDTLRPIVVPTIGLLGTASSYEVATIKAIEDLKQKFEHGAMTDVNCKFISSRGRRVISVGAIGPQKIWKL